MLKKKKRSAWNVGWETALSVKRLLCKYKDLNWLPRTHVKNCMWPQGSCMPAILLLGRQKQAVSQSSLAGRSQCLKNNVQRCVLTALACTDTYLHIQSACYVAREITQLIRCLADISWVPRINVKNQKQNLSVMASRSLELDKRTYWHSRLVKDRV